ncbi:MAG: hypothetical protein V4722_09970 [Bacteroidota bacterium]
MNESLTIEFLYGIDSMDPLLSLEEELRVLVEKEGAGTVDGNEIAEDDTDGRIFLYSADVRKMLEIIEPVFARYAFLKGAKLYLRFGNDEDAHGEEKMINKHGKIETLNVTDMRSLSPFPDWNFEKYRRDDGDEWKSNLKNDRARKLYHQWQQVYLLMEGLCEGLKTTDPEKNGEDDFPVSEEYLQHLKDMMMGDGMIIPAKIVGAEAGDLYVLRMENAAIIRKVADDTYKECSSFRMMGISTDAELDAVRAEIDIFREYFKEWVSGFEKDDWEDEWGLF